MRMGVSGESVCQEDGSRVGWAVRSWRGWEWSGQFVRDEDEDEWGVRY